MGERARRARAALLLLAVVATTQPVLSLSLPPAAEVVGGAHLTVERVLAAVLAVSVAGCWLWLSCGVAAGAARVLVTGSLMTPSRRAPRAARLIVTAVCGAGLTAALAGPASAVAGEPAPQVRLLQGLPYPDRVEGEGGRPSSVAAPGRQPHVTVLPGDSLWAIAARLHPDASAPVLTHLWRELYRINRQLIGPDPDLIRPGTRLTLPPPRGAVAGPVPEAGLR